MSGHDSQRGMVLVAVLWAIALCSVLAMAASVTFRSLAGIVAIDRDRVQADALLSAGLEVAAGMAAAANDPPLTARETTLTLPTGSVRVRASDEAGRIDVGRAPVEVLASLLRYAGAEYDNAETLSRKIVALRAPERPPGAAAAPQKPELPTSKSPFTDVRQLAAIPGMRPEWIAAMLPLTTVFGSDAVNPLTAPATVIRALPFFEDARLDTFLAARRAPFADGDRLAPLLGRTGQYMKAQQSQVVSVDLVATATDGFSVAAQSVIVLLPGDKQPYRVLAWNPGMQSAGRDGFVVQGDADER